MSHFLSTLKRFAEMERQAVVGHLHGLAGRVAIARRADSFPEMVRDQIELLPNTLARVRMDHKKRMAVLRELFTGA